MEVSAMKRQYQDASSDEEVLLADRKKKKESKDDAHKMTEMQLQDEYTYASSILKQHIEMKKATEEEIGLLRSANVKAAEKNTTLSATLSCQKTEMSTLQTQYKELEEAMDLKDLEIAELRRASSTQYSSITKDPEGIAEAAEYEVKSMYISLMEMAMIQYKDKEAALHVSMMPTPAPASASAPPPMKTIQMYQKNTSIPTERLVSFEVLPGSQDPVFCYDTGIPPCSWQPVFAEIKDAVVLGSLATLGMMTHDHVSGKKVFSPIVGQTANYTIGSNAYTTTVELRDKPTAPPPPAGSKLNLAQEMMFKGDFCKYRGTDRTTEMKTLIDMRDMFHSELNLLSAHDQTIAADMKKPPEHSAFGYFNSDIDSRLCNTFAEMANMFSSHGQGFSYDQTSVRLWLKPTWIHTWLRRATESEEYNQFCIGAHGSQTNDYPKFEKDMSGHNLFYHKSGRIGVGMYVSRNDSIASEYHRATVSYPKGSFEIGLQLLSDSTKPANHGGRSVESTNGAYTIFHYGTYGVANGTNGNSTLNDAIATRDSTTWLPIGLVVPTNKKKKASTPQAKAAQAYGASSSSAGTSSAGTSSAGTSSSAQPPQPAKKPRGRPKKASAA